MAESNRLLSYAFDCICQKDGGPGSGNFGHSGRPGMQGGSGPGGGSGNARAAPPPKESNGEEGLTPVEMSLEDLFADLWSESPDDQAERERKEREAEAAAEEEKKKRNAFGANGLLENEYPKDLQLSSKEQKRLQDEIADFYAEGRRSKKTDTNLTSEIYRAASGKPPMTDPAFVRRQAQEKINEADEMIAQRVAEGYKGLSREESYRKNQALKRALSEASEDEIGGILSEFAVGKNGIQHWQRQRKAAQQDLADLDFIAKLRKRADYAKKKSSGLDSRPVRRLMNLR